MVQQSLNPCSNGMLTEWQIIHRRRPDATCLNPCSNGMLTELVALLPLATLIKRLNPCSNGMLTEHNEFDELDDVLNKS